MYISVEVQDTAKRIPRPDKVEFSKLFSAWGLPTDTLEKLHIHVSFCRTPYRGEYHGCREGIHHIDISDLYCLAGIPQRFLEKATIHELRHVWWAHQDNPPADLGENDCQEVEKKDTTSFLWRFAESMEASQRTIS